MTTFDSAPPRWRRRALGTLASTAMVAAGLSAFANPAAAASNIYVNALGQDGPNCGTSFSACATIQAGVDKAQAGDTVLVAGGTYAESVDITKAITVKGDGATSTVIDGTGLTLPNGLVNITQPGGNVTFTGFTVRNQPPSGNGDAFGLTINDANAADTITVSNNVFPGDGSNPASSIGVNSADTAATQVITGNDFSGLWEGILLEGSSGPVDVSHNVFHDLVPADAGDGATYPPKGVFVLGDKNVTATDQNVTDNTFRSYGGIGIDYRAGYNLGGCAEGATCGGKLSGKVTGNVFALTAPAATNSDLASQQAAAISVQSLYADDELNLTVGGNTGTVDPPTKTYLEVPGAGTTTTTPGSPNQITPSTPPTLSFTPPASILSDGVVKEFSASATNNSGGPITNARYDLTITGTKGITAEQIKLEYDADPTSGVDFQPVPLTGTASAGTAITGYFGPVGGFTFPSSPDPVVTDFRLSFPSSATPPDTLTTKVDLDQVSSGTGNPVVNTLATSSGTTTVSDAPADTVVVSSAIAGQVSNTETTPVTATVKNVGGGVLAGKTVTFSVDLGYASTTETATSTTTKTVTATTDASGVATAYVGSPVVGTQTITAKADDASGTATKSYSANPTTLTLTPSSATFAAGTKQTFTATVTDVVGNPSPNTGVAFSNGAGPGLLDNTNVVTGADGKASVTLTTATTDTGSGTVTASVYVITGSLVKTATYTSTAAVPPTSVASVTPTLGTLAAPDKVQVVTVKVINGDNTTPPAGTEVDLLVSGASVANGTVATDASGNARFLFRVQHAGAFTVKAVAGGKSGTASATTPVRNVTTTLRVSSSTKGVIAAVASTNPVRPGVKMAFVIDQGSKRVGIVTAITDAKGVATQNLTGLKSGTVYAVTARIYGDPDSDSVNSTRLLIRVK